MSSSSYYKDGAWRFMKSILTEEYYLPSASIPMGFPTTQSVFDNEVKRAMSENYDERNIITRYYTINGGSGSNGIGYDQQIDSGILQPKGKLFFS